MEMPFHFYLALAFLIEKPDFWVLHGIEGRPRPTLTLASPGRRALVESSKAVLTPVIQAVWKEKPIAEAPR